MTFCLPMMTAMEGASPTDDAAANMAVPSSTLRSTRVRWRGLLTGWSQIEVVPLEHRAEGRGHQFR